VSDAVNFDHQPGQGAVEISTILPNRVLLAKGDALWRTFQALPQ
jgi:hypothetical protein